ncbi:MAG: hypothetical protein QNJ47_21320 [Nostocaceae cyanobacterium]|nr:hypothetical protein [Nostocaceae cyanobacterium]
MNGNGLKSFTFHAEDEIDKSYDIKELEEELRKANLAVTEPNNLKSAFKEIEELLKKILLSEPKLVGGSVESKENAEQSKFETFDSKEYHSNIKKSEFECLGTQKISFADTQLLKCRQKYNNILVYGAQVTVEVDDDNNLLSINSMIADSIGKVSPVPEIKQKEDIKDLIQKQTGHNLEDVNITPTLCYYFDSTNKKWRLVYLVEKKLNQTDAPIKFELIPEMVDYLVDAHKGKLVSQLPRVKTFQKV